MVQVYWDEGLPLLTLIKMWRGEMAYLTALHKQLCDQVAISPFSCRVPLRRLHYFTHFNETMRTRHGFMLQCQKTRFSFLFYKWGRDCSRAVFCNSAQSPLAHTNLCICCVAPREEDPLLRKRQSFVQVWHWWLPLWEELFSQVSTFLQRQKKLNVCIFHRAHHIHRGARNGKLPPLRHTARHL